MMEAGQRPARVHAFTGGRRAQNRFGTCTEQEVTIAAPGRGVEQRRNQVSTHQIRPHAYAAQASSPTHACPIPKYEVSAVQQLSICRRVASEIERMRIDDVYRVAGGPLAAHQALNQVDRLTSRNIGDLDSDNTQLVHGAQGSGRRLRWA